MYIRKTIDEYEIQQLYAGSWETVTTEETPAEAKAQLKCYRENEPAIPARIHKHRVRKEA